MRVIVDTSVWSLALRRNYKVDDSPHVVVFRELIILELFDLLALLLFAIACRTSLAQLFVVSYLLAYINRRKPLTVQS